MKFFLSLFVLLIIELFVISNSFVCVDASSNCPSFYVSFHGKKEAESISSLNNNKINKMSIKKSGVNNVYEYDLNGNLLTSNVLVGGSPSELRSMSSNNSHHLFIANADDNSSRVLEYGKKQSDGTRKFIRSFSSSSLDHPYGITWIDGYLYVSCQNINNIYLFDSNANFKGQFLSLNPDNIRGISHSFDESLLWVADKDSNQLIAYNVFSGQQNETATFAVNDPISSFPDKNSNSIFISSAKDNSILQYSLETFQLVQTFTHKNLSHPAGLFAYNGLLYVVNQDAQSIISFDISSGSYNSKVVSNLPDSPEDLLFVGC